MARRWCPLSTEGWSVRAVSPALGARRRLPSRHDRPWRCREVNGTALGLSRSEIRARIDDILAFAEIQTFDMPVRYYSPGMLASPGFFRRDPHRS